MDFPISDKEGEKLHFLLKRRDAMTLTVYKDQPKCKCFKIYEVKLSLPTLHARKGLKDRASRITSFLISLDYLLYVGANDFIKVYNTSWYGLNF